MANAARRYERTARVNEVVREVLADELERLSDPRLGFVTVTGVEVTPDLRQATVYYSALLPAKRPGAPVAGAAPEAAVDAAEETAAALRSAGPHLQSAIARQVRMKYTPHLVFREDPAIRTGERVDEILRRLHSEDE
ncbi:MAG: ribosome-binding factor A [Actinomycetota bacterium]|jgi:ribosome-binding factor A